MISKGCFNLYAQTHTPIVHNIMHTIMPTPHVDTLCARWMLHMGKMTRIHVTLITMITVTNANTTQHTVNNTSHGEDATLTPAMATCTPKHTTTNACVIFASDINWWDGVIFSTHHATTQHTCSIRNRRRSRLLMITPCTSLELHTIHTEYTTAKQHVTIVEAAGKTHNTHLCGNDMGKGGVLLLCCCYCYVCCYFDVCCYDM